ncbi:MAG: efflux RND transporter permease subunit [Akkermansiaceae bacterium]|nr:efflux RND transporter permease subunit [Akkermansiaceae bacterium]
MTEGDVAPGYLDQWRRNFRNRLRTLVGKDPLPEPKTGPLAQLRKKYPSVRYSFEGEQKDQRQSVGEMMSKFAIALLGMYVLMAIPLRSYVQPMIVMSVIPFGIVGAVIGHLVMGFSLSIMSMCGIVALAGVVVNDSLVLVDYVNRHRNDGHGVGSAVWEAGARRFRPILLTSLTTFAGLTPMLLETDIQARFLIPMAVSLSFGILFATAITLFLVPAIYLMLEDLKATLRLRRKVRDLAAETPPSAATTEASDRESISINPA